MCAEYVGTYELAPAVIQVVSLEGGDLYAQRSGHNSGKVNSMIDRRNNEDVVWKKSGSDAT